MANWQIPECPSKFFATGSKYLGISVREVSDYQVCSLLLRKMESLEGAYIKTNKETDTDIIS